MLLTEKKDFKGYIHDVGGPTANFRNPSCKKQLKHGMCRNKDCLFPKPCSQLDVNHEEYIDVLNSVRNIEKVKKVFIRSGIRYDYVMADKNDKFLNQLCKYHVSGILKVAPEHVSENVLKNMHKPSKEVFDKFSSKYADINRRLCKKQYMVPYFISSHPGSSLEDAVELALYMKKMGFVPDQVQDFYPDSRNSCNMHVLYRNGPFTMDPYTLQKR